MSKLVEKSAVWLGLALCVAACAAPAPLGEGVELSTELLGGVRSLSHDDFDGHGTIGLAFVTLEEKSGWGYEAGASYGAEEQGGPRDLEGEFSEFYLGVRKTWVSSESNARPYLGLGGAYTVVEYDLNSPSFDLEDEGGGVYVHGGVLWALGELRIDQGTSFLAGFDLRGVIGDDYDYGQVALVLAFGR
jgi:hypothetical protein